MNAEQRVALLQVVEDDCKIRCLYVDRNEEGELEYCLLGGMMIAAGIDVVSELKGTHNILPISEVSLRAAAGEVGEFFGLNTGELRLLQVCNDGLSTREERQVSVRELIASWRIE